MYYNYLQHHGILGMHWGVRRFQNKDGSLTVAGKRRAGIKDSRSNKGEKEKKKGLSDKAKKRLKVGAAIAGGTAAAAGAAFVSYKLIDKMRIGMADKVIENYKDTGQAFVNKKFRTKKVKYSKSLKNKMKYYDNIPDFMPPAVV